MLTDAKVRNLKAREKRYTVADRDGLYIDVRPNGAKSWLLRVKRNGKYSWAGVGAYPLYGLAEAREKALQMSRVNEGVAEQADDEKPFVSFRSVAEEYVPRFEQSGVATSTMRNFYSLMETHVYPELGEMDISKITPKDIFAIAEKKQNAGLSSVAKRIVSSCSRIFRYAIIKEYCVSDPCYALRGSLASHESKHHPAITDLQAVGKLMRDIYAEENDVRRSLLLFCAYTFCRPAEVAGARWEEIDIERRVWSIPASRMKMKREHLVPLTRQMLDVLSVMDRYRPYSDWIFPSFVGMSGDRMTKPVPSQLPNTALRFLGYSGKQTAHGFRGIASTILNEHDYNTDWIEVQLAHVPTDRVRASYNRAKYWDGRVEMIQWYNDYLDELRDKENN